MLEVIVRSFFGAMPVIFLLCVTGLATKIGFTAVMLYILIRMLIELDLWLVFDAAKGDRK